MSTRAALVRCPTLDLLAACHSPTKQEPLSVLSPQSSRPQPAKAEFDDAQSAMPLGTCMERAINMTIPRWGPPRLADTGEPVDYNSDFSRWNGSFQIAPVSWSTSRFDNESVQHDNVTFHGRCGVFATTVPFWPAPTSIVINVTAITNTHAERAITVYMGSCDGNVTFNTTSPGTFVVRGPAAPVMVECRGASTRNATDDCPGESSAAFSSATLEDFCRVDSSLAECNTSNKSSPGGSNGVSAVKRSLVLSVGSVLATLLVAMV